MILDLKIDENAAKYVNLGDWISYFTYGVFDGEEFKILKHGETENAQRAQRAQND
jgi:UDP-2,3-diacylglucosamine hydrolase